MPALQCRRPFDDDKLMRVGDIRRERFTNTVVVVRYIHDKRVTIEAVDDGRTTEVGKGMLGAKL